MMFKEGKKVKIVEGVPSDPEKEKAFRELEAHNLRRRQHDVEKQARAHGT